MTFMLRPTSLQLKELVFPQVSVQALVPSVAADAPRELALDELNISFGFDLSTDGAAVTAGLKVESKERVVEAPSNALYAVHIEAFAKFVLVSAEHVDERALYLRRCAAASALVGAVREQVSLMTSRGPWGVVMLPMISMDLIVGPPPRTQVPVSPPAVALPKPRAKRVTAK
jgi:hypothetical protein